MPNAEILAFPLVGAGDAYKKSGFEIRSALSLTPSGGVLKYSLKDLLGDMRSGLLRDVRAQLNDWKKLAHKIRTPICAGDVYLLLHTLWGSGARPVFMATAKTVYLSGHWRLERALINKFTLKTWARDQESADELGAKALYTGNPIMDILYEGANEKLLSNDREILLLPGSRARALKDVKLLLDTAIIIRHERELNFRMVLAPTIDFDEFIKSCKDYGWDFDGSSNELTHGAIRIELTTQSIASASNGIKILIGLGGTANQLCAGLGIPVISIDEKGKRVQKKLLGDAEILVKPSADELAGNALKIIDDEALYKFMSEAGKKRMGHPGALDGIVNYVCENLGWDIRENVYCKLKTDSNIKKNVLIESQIISNLKTGSKIQRVINFDDIDSTNEYAKKISLEGASHGTLITANHQTAGKGRHGHKFESPAGTGLYMSLITRPKFDEAGNFQMMTIAAAVAVCKSIEDLTSLKPVIKWVNDVYLNNKKICGILTEAVNNPDKNELVSIVTGIGVNISTKKFEADIAGSIMDNENIKPFDRNELAAKIADYLIDYAEDLSNHELINFYRSRSFLLGHKIKFMRGDQEFQAEAVDINSDGGLIIKNFDGSNEILRSGEVFLIRPAE